MKLFSIFKKKENKKIYKCSCCGQVYDDLPLCFGADFPYYYYSIPPDQRDTRVEKTESLCVIDEEHFFVRGHLTIPINDHSKNLTWNVWTTISRENFTRVNDLWNDPERVNEEPYFGWFETIIPTYSQTINIKSLIHTEPVGLIPTIEIIEENHQLRKDQQEGITLERAFIIVDSVMKDQHSM